LEQVLRKNFSRMHSWTLVLGCRFLGGLFNGSRNFIIQRKFRKRKRNRLWTFRVDIAAAIFRQAKHQTAIIIKQTRSFERVTANFLLKSNFFILMNPRLSFFSNSYKVCFGEFT